MDEIGWAFHRRYSDSGVIWQTRWLGTPICKCPFDLWVYQEILFRTRPDVIIETGTLFGGSALYLASMCDLLGNGRVITIDVQDWGGDRPTHPRILYLAGSSIAREVVDRVQAEISDSERVMAILDSDHHMDHVLGELQAFGPLVTRDCYLIVEDTPAAEMEQYVAGPAEAIEEYLESNDSFVVDPSCEKFLMTGNPGGFLKRVHPPPAG
jgi:cephalosporin hydroxylase